MIIIKNVISPNNRKCFVKMCALRRLSTTDHCLELVRKYDYENFICTLLLQKNARNAGIVIRAFNVEVAKIQDHVTNTQLGGMKYKFWEDALDQCFSRNGAYSPNHPVVTELRRVLESHKYTRRYFTNLINSRKEILSKNKFKDLEDMERYAERSVSSVYYLLLESSNVRNIHADHVASHLGKAQGICQMLRGLTVTSKTNFIPMPQDLLTQYKVKDEDFIRGKCNSNIKEVVYRVATRANQHLEKARSLTNKVPDEAKVVFLPACVVNDYLQRLLRADFNVFHKSLHIVNRSWIPIVWWKNVTKTY